MGRLPRLLLQFRQAPRTFDRVRASSGCWLMGMMWSAVVDRRVQPSRLSQQMGSSRMACLASFRQAWVERMRLLAMVLVVGGDGFEEFPLRCGWYCPVAYGVDAGL